jgi:hypothetical protein
MKKMKLKRIAQMFAKLERSDDPQKEEKMMALVEKYNLSLVDMLEIDEYIQKIFDNN